jgi:hypothetical protein
MKIVFYIFSLSNNFSISYAHSKESFYWTSEKSLIEYGYIRFEWPYR